MLEANKMETVVVTEMFRSNDDDDDDVKRESIHTSFINVSWFSS